LLFANEEEGFRNGFEGGFQMSSYLVDDRTVNRILTAISNEKHYVYWLKGSKNLADTFFEDNELEELGKKMLKMNRLAVSIRYRKDRANEEKFEKYFNLEIETASKIQALKSLKCFLYQCNESSLIENCFLYKTLRKIESSMMNKIISDLPEYESAEWG